MNNSLKVVLLSIGLVLTISQPVQAWTDTVKANVARILSCGWQHKGKLILLGLALVSIPTIINLFKQEKPKAKKSSSHASSSPLSSNSDVYLAEQSGHAVSSLLSLNSNVRATEQPALLSGFVSTLFDKEFIDADEPKAQVSAAQVEWIRTTNEQLNAWKQRCQNIVNAQASDQKKQLEALEIELLKFVETENPPQDVHETAFVTQGRAMTLKQRRRRLNVADKIREEGIDPFSIFETLNDLDEDDYVKITAKAMCIMAVIRKTLGRPLLSPCSIQ